VSSPVLQRYWVLVDNMVAEFYEKAFKRINELLSDGECDGNYLSYSSFGVYNALTACVMGSFYTVLGYYAPKIMAVFFRGVRPLPPPFSFEGFLPDGTEMQVKVVVSRKSLNSTLRNRVVQQSHAYVNPVILTLEEDEAFGALQLTHRLTWYDAYLSWRLVTGDPNGLRVFRTIYRGRAKEFRDRVRAVIKAYADKKYAEFLGNTK